MNMTARYRRTRTRILLGLGFALISAGCTSINQREYAPFVRDLDGLNELAISTYPADFPDRLSDKGEVFEKYESAGELYLQVHIRDSNKQIGPNPHVESINIHSFSYRVGDGPVTVLLSDYENNFWMQGNPRYEKRDLPPVPYVPGGRLSINISFTLNGDNYAFEGDMAATEQSSVLPTTIVDQGV